MKKFLHWLDQHILLILSSFLLAFIPLYPKLPLFDALPGYIVRVRIEDVLVLITTLIYLLQFFRKKVSWENAIDKWIFAYVVIAALSIFSGIFVIKTIPLELLHIGKSVLHWLRYIEYFSLFFVLFAAVRKRSDLKIILITLAVTTLLIIIYGYGQKYLYWPVYSTMNREFSKGMRLYLTEHARVQSTFGGHYDLAAFLVIVLPVFFTLGLKLKKKWPRLLFRLLHWLGLWLLLVCASRTSFIAYLFAIFVTLLLSSYDQKTWQKKLWWIFRRGLAYSLALIVMTYAFGADMRDRFEQVLRGYPESYAKYEESVAYLDKETESIAQFFKEGLWKVEKPSNGIAFDNSQEDILAVIPTPTVSNVLTSTDQQPKPVDVYVDVPDKVLVASDSGEMVYVEQERTWSDNALKYGLSFAIRLDELWPNAIKGFLKNPVFGSAYATLNKKEFYQFTEAESTDNNFLRTLGETGLLGFLSFYGAIVVLLVVLWKNLKYQDNELQMLNVAFIAATLGLLLNATYIDVFASSKVAFTFWALAGAVLAYNQLATKNAKTQTTTAKKAKH